MFRRKVFLLASFWNRVFVTRKWLIRRIRWGLRTLALGYGTILRSYLSFVSTIAMLRSKLAQNSAIVQLDTNRYSLPAWYLEMANNSQTGKFWQTDKGGWGECFYLTISNKESETVSAVWTRAKLGVKIWIAKQVLYRTLVVGGWGGGEQR